MVVNNTKIANKMGTYHTNIVGDKKVFSWTMFFESKKVLYS